MNRKRWQLIAGPTIGPTTNHHHKNSNRIPLRKAAFLPTIQHTLMWNGPDVVFRWSLLNIAYSLYLVSHIIMELAVEADGVGGTYWPSLSNWSLTWSPASPASLVAIVVTSISLAPMHAIMLNCSYSWSWLLVKSRSHILAMSIWHVLTKAVNIQHTRCFQQLGSRKGAVITLFWHFWVPKGLLCDPKIGRKLLLGQKCT